MQPSIMKEDRFSFWESFWFFSIVAIQFGVAKHPISLSGKILMYAWAWFTLILVASYTANLVTIFSADKPQVPLKSIQDIPNSNYQVAAIDSSEKYLGNLGNKVLDTLIKDGRIDFTVKEDQPKNLRLKHINEKLQSNYIWIDADTEFYWLMENIPNLYLLKGYFKYTAFGLAIRKDWKWADPVKKEFIKFGKNGFFSEVIQKYEEDKSEKKDVTTSLGANECARLFVLMSIIAILSSLLVIVHILCRSQTQVQQLDAVSPQS